MSTVTEVVSDWPACFVLLYLTTCWQLMQCGHATCVLLLDNMVTTSVMLYNLTTIWQHVSHNLIACSQLVSCYMAVCAMSANKWCHLTVFHVTWQTYAMSPDSACQVTQQTCILPPDNSVMSPDNLCLFLNCFIFLFPLKVIGSRGPLEINPRLVMVKEAQVLGVMLFGSTPVSCCALCFPAVLWDCWRQHQWVTVLYAFPLCCGITGLNTGELQCSVLSRCVVGLLACCTVGLLALTPVSRSALCFLAVLWYCWPQHRWVAVFCAFLLRCEIAGLKTGESQCSVLFCCTVGLLALTLVSRSALCFPVVLWYCWP